jgi:hypothetical protein
MGTPEGGERDDDPGEGDFVTHGPDDTKTRAPEAGVLCIASVHAQCSRHGFE